MTEKENITSIDSFHALHRSEKMVEELEVFAKERGVRLIGAVVYPDTSISIFFGDMTKLEELGYAAAIQTRAAHRFFLED